MDYSAAAVKAEEALKAKGKQLLVRSYTSGKSDRAIGSTVRRWTDTMIWCVVLSYHGVSQISGTQIEAGDKRVLMSAVPGIVPDVKTEITIGSDIYTVVVLQEINPAGTPVLYDLLVRR